MTREELLAQAEALEWALEFGVTREDIFDRARELRAQAEAMPEQEPVAWCLAYDDPSLRVRIHSNPSMYKPELERIAKQAVSSKLVIVDLYTHPAPDRSARIAELEGLLREVLAHWDDETGNAATMCDTIELARAALAKGEKA